MPDLWVPGASGPHEDLVAAIHRQIASHGDNAAVELELKDGSRFDLISLSAEPGFGFVTVSPHPDDDGPSEVIVPLTAIAQIKIHAPEERPQFGFSLPD